MRFYDLADYADFSGSILEVVYITSEDKNREPIEKNSKIRLKS